MLAMKLGKVFFIQLVFKFCHNVTKLFLTTMIYVWAW